MSPVPHDALPSDLLENVLCGVAFGLGVLGVIIGSVLIIKFRKPCSGGTSGTWRGWWAVGAVSDACVGVPGLSWAWGGLRVALRPLGGRLTRHHGHCLVGLPVTHTVMGHRDGFE